MPSEDNVEIVRRSFHAFANGDFDVAFSAYHPGIEWRTAADEPDRETHRGLAGLGTLLDSLAEPWTDRFDGVMRFEPLIECGDAVVVPWSALVHGRGSGIAVDIQETYVVHLRDARIVCVEEYRTTDEALAGLAG
jgi:ketosteroid isomerase-like protein